MDKFIVSARKYRPQNFSTVVGQSHITTTLKNAINNNQLAHAFLFCGPRGVGKTTCARILAKTINCENKTPDGEACNTCNSCVSFDNGSSLNIHELDAASNNSVDDIRALVDQIRFAPQAGEYKVYIVDEVHMLSAQAFNAFLKTLEEPPPFAIFILATTEKHKILPTILSRCQIFDFKRITINDTVDHLKDICNKENIEAEKAGLHVIAQKSEGCLRDALSILDKIVSFSNGKLTYTNTLEHLNILDEDYFFRMIEFMQEQKLSDALLLFDEINQKGFEGDTFLDGFSEFIRNMLVSKDAKAAALLEVAADFRDKYISMSTVISTGWLVAALNILNECSLNFKQARNKRLTVEMALIKLSYLKQAVELVENGSGISKKKLADSSKPVAFRNVNFIPINEMGASAKAAVKVQEKVVIEATPKEETKLYIEPVKAAAKQETAPPAEGRSSSLSLSKIRKQVAVKNLMSNAPKEITTEELQKCWDKFIEFLQQNENNSAVTNFKNTLLNVKDAGCIELVVETAFQQKFIDAERAGLIDHFQSYFNNKTLTYQVNIIKSDNEEEVTEKVLNKREQYQILAKKYPLIRELKERLQLNIE